MSQRMSAEERAATIAACRDAAELAEAALKAETKGDDNEAIAAWQQVFGSDSFPAPAPGEASRGFNLLPSDPEFIRDGIGAAAFGQLARLLACSGHSDQAADAYRRVLELEPGNADARLEIVEELQLAGHPEAADQAVAKARAFLGDVPAVDIAEGRLLLARNLSDAAAVAFARAAEAAPDSANAYIGLTYALMGQAKWAEAANAAARASALDTTIPLPLRLQGQALIAISPQQAEDVFRGVLEQWDDDIDSRLGLALALERQGRVQEASSAARSTLELDPTNSAAAELLARCAATAE